MSYTLIARIGVNIIGQCLSCLQGASTGSKDASSLFMIATRTGLGFHNSDSTYGSCFRLEKDLFEQYDFNPPGPSSDDDDDDDDASISLSLDKLDLSRCADYAHKIGAQQIKLECSERKFLIHCSAPNGHSHQQGFTLLADDQRSRRRAMPIDSRLSGSPIGIVQTVYANQLKAQLDLFKSTAEVKVAFQPEERNKVGMMFSAEDSKYIARFPLREASPETKQFFCLYRVSQPIFYRLNTTSVNRLHQILKACSKYVRSVRIELFIDALMWQFDVGGGGGVDTRHLTTDSVFVRHDIPQMSGQQQ